MKKGDIRAEAITLNSIDFSESDRIIGLYTREEGKVTAIAKGARRSKRRFVGKLDPPTRLKLLYVRGRGELVRLDEAVLICGYRALKTDVETLARACYITEFTTEMTREGQRNPEFFDIVTAFLSLIEDGAQGEARGKVSSIHGVNYDMLLRFFEIKALKVLGFMPELKRCLGCKEEVESLELKRGGAALGLLPKLHFSSSAGGVFCGACLNTLSPSEGAAAMKVSAQTIAFLSTAARLPIDKLSRLRPGEVFRREGEKLLDDFIRFHVGREFKSRIFMDKLGGSHSRAYTASAQRLSV
jgi:DNA repair protein RecO (recombination protein O)